MYRKLFSCVLMGYLVARCLFWGGAGLLAQVSPTPPIPKAEQKLTAEDIVDLEVKAKGGEASQKVKTFAFKLKIVTGDNVARLSVSYAGPGKHRLAVELDGIGTQEAVVNGDQAWGNDTLSGARFLNDEEKKQMVAKAEYFADIFRTAGDWRKQCKEVQLLGEEVVNGKAAYKVQMTTLQGEKSINYYDKHSSLMVRREVFVGDEHAVEHYSDFRKVDGLVQPFTTRVVNGSLETIVTIEHFAPNAEIPAELFVLPTELQRQIEK